MNRVVIALLALLTLCSCFAYEYSTISIDGNEYWAIKIDSIPASSEKTIYIAHGTQQPVPLSNLFNSFYDSTNFNTLTLDNLQVVDGQLVKINTSASAAISGLPENSTIYIFGKFLGATNPADYFAALYSNSTDVYDLYAGLYNRYNGEVGTISNGVFAPVLTDSYISVPHSAMFMASTDGAKIVLGKWAPQLGRDYVVSTDYSPLPGGSVRLVESGTLDMAIQCIGVISNPTATIPKVSVFYPAIGLIKVVINNDAASDLQNVIILVPKTQPWTSLTISDTPATQMALNISQSFALASILAIVLVATGLVVAFRTGHIQEGIIIVLIGMGIILLVGSGVLSGLEKALF